MALEIGDCGVVLVEAESKLNEFLEFFIHPHAVGIYYRQQEQLSLSLFNSYNTQRTSWLPLTCSVETAMFPSSR